MWISLNCQQHCCFVHLIRYVFASKTFLDVLTSCASRCVYNFRNCSVCGVHTIKKFLCMQTLRGRASVRRKTINRITVLN
jgi:hypothetical protein